MDMEPLIELGGGTHGDRQVEKLPEQAGNFAQTEPIVGVEEHNCGRHAGAKRAAWHIRREVRPHGGGTAGTGDAVALVRGHGGADNGQIPDLIMERGGRVERTGGEIRTTVRTARGAQEDGLGDLIRRGGVAGDTDMVRLSTGLAGALAFGRAGGRPRWVG